MKKFRLTRKSMIIIAIVFILAAGGIFSYWNEKQDDFNENTNKEGGAKQTLTENGTKLKEDGTPIKATVPSENSPDPSKSTVNPRLTFTGQSGGRISIRAIVDANNGTCKVIFSKSGQKNVERTAPVGLVTSYYTCQGFDIESAEFPIKGDWQVKVEYFSDSATGVSETKTIGIN